MVAKDNFNLKYDDGKKQKTLEEVKADIENVLSKLKQIDEELDE